ncbi:hypothetical protein ACFL5E_04545, partial [Candidatus Omnitrophota bacterium]
GLLEFEATLELEEGSPRKVRFILDARDYFTPQEPGYGLSDGFGLTLVRYPGWGGAMGDVHSGRGAVTYDWDGFFAKTLEETAAGGLVLLKNAMMPSSHLIKENDLECLHSTELKKPGQVGENEHVIYKKSTSSDNIKKERTTDAMPEEQAESKTKGEEGASEAGCAKILERASSAIPRFVNALIAASRRDEKVVLALDLELGEGEINALIRKLIKMLPTIEGNNGDLKRFFENLEIIRGEGAQLAQRVSNVTDPSRGGVKPENVIVITRNANVAYYKKFEGKATVAGVEDGTFSENAYLPLLEIMLFAIGRHLGWDEATLIEHYAMIPNVTSASDLTPEDYALLFGKDKMIMVIRLIPDAEEFDKKELREMIDSVRTMLARA